MFGLLKAELSSFSRVGWDRWQEERARFVYTVALLCQLLSLREGTHSERWKLYNFKSHINSYKTTGSAISSGKKT